MATWNRFKVDLTKHAPRKHAECPIKNPNPLSHAAEGGSIVREPKPQTDLSTITSARCASMCLGHENYWEQENNKSQRFTVSVRCPLPLGDNLLCFAMFLCAGYGSLLLECF